MYQANKIHPSLFQTVLESASNAAAKGQAQYLTPLAWAKVLALPLPKFRPVIVDLTAGSGHLLLGTSSHSHLLACDIDPMGSAGAPPAHEPAPGEQSCPEPNNHRLAPNFVTADVTKFHALLKEVKFRADLFVLNPPWDMFWYRDRFVPLAESFCAAVAQAFPVHDGRTGRDTIDSTIATLCMALDACSSHGEGYLIANEATLQRLLFAPKAPHRALVNHIWAHLIIDDNICTGSAPAPGANERASREQPNSASSLEPGFRTGVIYFARADQSGHALTYHVRSLEDAELLCTSLGKNRLVHRRGAVIDKAYAVTKNTEERWQSARLEWQRLTGERKAPEWNISLGASGEIITDLSLFDQHAERVPMDEVKRLFALRGKHPMQLVIQKTHRQELERAAFGENDRPSIWRVAPAVQKAVREAIIKYNAVRAPLRPLDAIQRLGFLDEHDQITCTKDLFIDSKPRATRPDPVFRAGQAYPVRTLTIAVSRAGEKMNNHGTLDEVEWTGSELAFFLGGAGREYLFMESRLRAPGVTLSLNTEPVKGQKQKLPDPPAAEVRIDFTLQQLVSHFEIPEVPDVAALNPEGYAHNLMVLDQIEQLINAA